MSCNFFRVFATLAIGVLPLDADAAEPHAARRMSFEAEVLPILVSRCGHCHGPDKQEAEVRFDQLSIHVERDRAAAQVWHEALNAINAAEMPPEGEPPLGPGEREILVRWMTQAIREAVARQSSTGGRGTLRRLNREEYQNTMADLLGLDMDYARDLPPDGTSNDGFRNHGQSLRMSSIQLETYLNSARRALDRIIVKGPPPRVFRHRFEQSNVGNWRGPTETSNRLERAQKFLAKIVDDYPEEGEFRVRVQTRATLRADKGFPILEVAVGYRPDTEVHFRVVGAREIVSEDLQQLEFRGSIENFPLPVRGQGKYPGLVIRLRNVYDDGTEMPSTLEEVERDGQKRKAFREEPLLPHLLIESVEFEGPVFADWPPQLHRNLLFESELRNRDDLEYSRQVLERFMSRAYRRRPTISEVEEMIQFLKSIRSQFPDFEDAMRETLSLVLIQPDFLYLMEPSGEHKQTLNDWQLASRLSYFLWSTMPDQRLFELAASGLLHKPSVLEAELNRMLTDQRVQRFSTQFVSQWLQLDHVDHVSVDQVAYPDFRDSLKSEMRRETTEFFAQLLRTDESALLLLQSDFTMLNEPLARHYGLEGVFGQRFRAVKIGRSGGGLLGHASILLANSNGRDAHAIRRAVWIRDRLLGDPPSPPPPDVPDLDEMSPEFAKMSVREQLAAHRQKESCAACHRNIDPWGIVLENFDAVGRWRNSIHGQANAARSNPVVAEDVLPDGTRIHGAEELKSYLVQHRRQQFAQALVRRIMTYALGRTMELSDEKEVDLLSEQFLNDGFRLRRLMHRIVASQAFRTK